MTISKDRKTRDQLAKQTATIKSLYMLRDHIVDGKDPESFNLDLIAEEVGERFVAQPVDADGEIVRFGDLIASVEDGTLLEVERFELRESAEWFELGEWWALGTDGRSLPVRRCRIAKELTDEEALLGSFADDLAKAGMDVSTVIAAYSGRIKVLWP